MLSSFCSISPSTPEDVLSVLGKERATLLTERVEEVRGAFGAQEGEHFQRGTHFVEEEASAFLDLYSCGRWGCGLHLGLVRLDFALQLNFV